MKSRRLSILLAGAAAALLALSSYGLADTDTVATGEKTVGGDKSYTLTLDLPDSAAKGSEGVAQVIVVPKKGWKINQEFPTKLKVTPPAGVRVTKASQTVSDAVTFTEKRAVFAVKFVADTKGNKSFKAKFKFAVCTEQTCDPKKQTLTWDVDVR